MIEIFTDGASRGNPGPGGFGTILRYQQHYKELSQGFRKTTNNRMEMMAVIVGLEAIKGNGKEITVYSDSKYVVDAIEKKWVFGWVKKNFKDKKNEDLWRRMLPLLQRHKVKFVWVKGHAGHAMNERCDELAVSSALQSNLPPDIGYENL